MNSTGSRDPLQTVSDIASVASYFKLGSIDDQIASLERTIQGSHHRADKQNRLRDLIFNFRTFADKGLSDISDPIVRALALVALQRAIERSNLTTASFDAIPDKQYFNETLEMLQTCRAKVAQYLNPADSILVDFRTFRLLDRIQVCARTIHQLTDRLRFQSSKFSLFAGLGAIILFLIFRLANVQMADFGSLFYGAIAGVILYYVVQIPTRNVIQSLYAESTPLFEAAGLPFDAEDHGQTFQTASANFEIAKATIEKHKEQHPELTKIQTLINGLS